MACCVLLAALFGTAMRKIRRQARVQTPVAAARWEPPAGDSWRTDSRSTGAADASRKG
jgi:hypothetical protein